MVGWADVVLEPDPDLILVDPIGVEEEGVLTVDP